MHFWNISVLECMNSTHERFVCPDEFNAVDVLLAVYHNNWSFIFDGDKHFLQECRCDSRCDNVQETAKDHLFIFSLVVTDLLLAILILLFAITNQGLGYWTF